MQILNFLRLLIAFQVGLFVSVSVTLLMCILLAAHLNYFSGIDPASLIFELPWFWLLANLAGGSLLVGLDFFAFGRLKSLARSCFLGSCLEWRQPA